MWLLQWVASEQGTPTRRDAAGMTNKLALIIGLIIVSIFAADLFYFGWNLHLFLGRKMVEFIEYLAFWR